MKDRVTPRRDAMVADLETLTTVETPSDTWQRCRPVWPCWRTWCTVGGA